MRVFGLGLGAVARPQGVEGALLVDALVGVRAEEVALTLDEGGGRSARTVVVRTTRAAQNAGTGMPAAAARRPIRRQAGLPLPSASPI